MIAHPDTSFLCSLYRKQEHSPAAIAHRETMGEPLFCTRLLEFEFLQAVQLQVWLQGTLKNSEASRVEHKRPNGKESSDEHPQRGL